MIKFIFNKTVSNQHKEASMYLVQNRGTNRIPFDLWTFNCYILIQNGIAFVLPYQY